MSFKKRNGERVKIVSFSRIFLTQNRTDNKKLAQKSVNVWVKSLTSDFDWNRFSKLMWKMRTVYESVVIVSIAQSGETCPPTRSDHWPITDGHWFPSPFLYFPTNNWQRKFAQKKLKFLMQQAALYDLLMGQFGKGRNSIYYYGWLSFLKHFFIWLKLFHNWFLTCW